MAIRVDREMYDPAGLGSTSSGMSVYDDGTKMGPWMDRPWKGKEDYVVSEAMRQMIIPRAAIAAIRPPVPYELMPQQFGYIDRTPLSIEEVLDTDRWAPQRRSWVSGGVRPRRVDMEEQMWSGTMRGMLPSDGFA